MKKTFFLLALAGAFLALARPAGATTYRAGLLQSKLSGDTQWSAAAPTADAERTPGAVMAQVQVGSDDAAATDGYQNPWTGNTTYWNAQKTTFAYTGQMWMEGGTTYTFGKSLDDGARIEIDGTRVMENNSWNSWVTASYTPSYTGWHEVDIRVSDGTGGKGPCPNASSVWGTAYGLGWNTNNVTSANLTDWTWFIEDGVTNVFRVVTDDVMATSDSVTATATGFDFAVTASPEAPVSVALYRTASSDYDNALSWTPATTPVTIAAGASGTISLATEETSYANYQVGVFNADDSVGWFYQFIPFGPIGSFSATAVNGKSIIVSATVDDLGATAESATMTLEASLASSFSEIVSRSETVDAEVGEAQSLSVYGLAYNTAYYLRLRIETDDGMVVHVTADPVTTAVAPFDSGTVYAAGLVQAQFGTGQEDRTSDIATAADRTIASGTVMADTTGNATDWAGTTWSWAGSRNFGYLGEMYMEGGTTYTFGKSVDDWTYIVIDGNVLLDDNVWNSFGTCSYTPTVSGWVPVLFRFGNGGGGAGVSQSAAQGFAYNTAGNTTWDDFKAGSSPWARVVDDGSMSLLRCVYSSTPFMTVSAVSVDGDDLQVTASFSGVLEDGAVFQALWGGGDGEYAAGNWDNVTALATIDAGDTAEATYAVTGAGAASFVAFRIVSADGATVPWVQWSEIYNLAAESPVFGLVSTLVDYTNLSYTATCSGLGAGATSVETTFQIATDPAFENIFFERALGIVEIGGEQIAVTGFTTNTTYYARVVGENNLGESGVSGTVAATTLNPQFAEGTASFSGRGFTTLSATAVVTTFGTGSDSATIRFEASTDGFATVAGASADVAATVGTGTLLAVPDLAPATAYSLRLRIVNEWGLATYVPIAGTFSTRDVPIAASGIGYEFSSDGSTVDLSFGVTEVYDGATCTATLVYDGRTAGSQTFSAADTLSWSGVAAASSAATATVTVTATVDGTTYAQTWTATATPGTKSVALPSLSDLSSVVFSVGDTATLPELTGADDYYVAMDIRSFSIGDDGVTLTALEPGFSAVVTAEWDASASAYAMGSVRALAVCIPEVEGSGRVFLATAKNIGWANAANWRNLSDPSAEPDYPRLPDDVAMVALPGDQIVVSSDITIGELYFGPNEKNLNTGTEYLTANNNGTLTFRRSSGKPGLLRFTGLARTDTPLLASGWTSFQIGGWSGNATTGLGIEMPGGLVLDCGAWPDYTAWGTPEVDSFGRARYYFKDMRYWNIPEGQTLRIVNTYGRNKMTGDDQGGNANFCWENKAQVTGKGTFLYDGASSTYFDNPFYLFEGTVAVRNKQKYDNFSFGSRGGSFWMVNWTRPTQFATNATLVVEGDTAYSGFGASFGVASYGNAHGYGSWGWTDNALPGKAWILNGGSYRAAAMNNNNVSWREDGTTATQPVCVPNGAETLVVSNGFSCISLGQNGDADRPTNSVAFARLEHTGDGTLRVGTDRTYYSYYYNGAGANWRVRAVLGGFHDHAIGGTGLARAVHGDASVRTNILESTAPIVPWIVSDVQYGTSLYFPGADDETDEIVMAGHPTGIVLDEVADPTMNVNVKGQTSLTLTEDRTVNSLRVPNPNGGSATFNLGEDRTLTITSGGLIAGDGNHSRGGIGNESGYTDGTAGTVYFPNKAYIYAPSQNGDVGKHAEIWASLVSPKGAVFSFPGYLVLGGDQTGIDDHIAVNGTYLRLGSTTTGCEIDVPVHLHGFYSTLHIMKEGSFCKQDLYFWDHGTPGSKFVPVAGTTEKVHKAYIDGVSVKRGVWGSSESSAPNVDDAHFAGTGTVKILADDLLQPTIFVVF